MNAENTDRQNEADDADHGFGGALNGREERDERGVVSISNTVILDIARHVALGVKGVSDLAFSRGRVLAGLMRHGTTDRGVHVRTDDTTVELDLHVVLDYGVRIPQVAWRLQHDVRAAIEHATGKEVKAVNIIVQSVRLPGPGAPADNGGAGL